MMPNCPKDVDVAVIGGGPAGAGTAVGLARAGFTTALFDRSNRSHQRIGETLPPAANPLLQELGIWNSFRNQKHLPAEGIVSVWNDTRPQFNDFFLSSQGPGWNLDRNRFDTMLLQEGENAGAVVCRDASVVSCYRRHPQGWELEFRSAGSTFKVGSRYLVVASGRIDSGAPFSLKSIVMDRLVGVTRFFRCGDRSRYTLVEATEQGWFYSAGLPSDRFVAVYFTDADIYSRGRKLDPNYWHTQLEKAVHTRDRLRDSSLLGQERIVSAATSRSAQVTGDGWIGVGDAALSFDPLSSLGIYKALDSTLWACHSIVRAFRGNHTCTSYANWSDEIFGHYLNLRREFYRAQTRWPESAFWQRRRE
jgi:2-polyprenyl-6-methoxyphenol hydroxylase-like FAD-dependent oxidoreductase